VNCTQASDLIPLYVLGALEPGEHEAVTAQLGRCEHCQEQAGVFESALSPLAPPADQLEPLGVEVREGVMAVVYREAFSLVEEVVEEVEDHPAKPKSAPPPLDPPGDPQRVEEVAAQIVISCTYCHGQIARQEAVFCAGCLAPHHGECVATHGSCAAPGCEETRTVDPQSRVVRPVSAGRLLTLLCVASVAGVVGVGLALGLIAPPVVREVVVSAPAEPSVTPSVAPSASPAPDPRAWGVVFEAQAPGALEALRQAVSRREAKGAGVAQRTQARGAVDEAITRIGEVSRIALRDSGASRDGRARVSLLLTRARKALPRAVAEVRAVPRGDVLPQINVDVEEADLADVMEQIGARAGRNILVDPNVQETVTVTLQEIPWLEAVEVIAKMVRCDVEERPGGVILLTQPALVTIQYTDANVRTVLQLLAAYAGKNIVIGPGVKGVFTMDLKGVHWLRAIYSIAKAFDCEVIEESNGLLLVVTREAFELRLDRAVDLDRSLAELRLLNAPPADLVTLEAKRALVGEVCAQIARQSGRRVVLDAGLEPQRVTLRLARVPWRTALDVIAARCGLEISESPQGARLRAPLQSRLRVYRASVRACLELLAEAGGVRLELLAGGEAERIELKLSELRPTEALDAVLRASGWTFTRVDGVLRVEPRVASSSTKLAPYPPVELVLASGRKVRLEVELLYEESSGRESRALISGRPYRLGEALLDAEGKALGLRWTEVFEGRALLLAEEGRPELHRLPVGGH
jgi:hypothetical protein